MFPEPDATSLRPAAVTVLWGRLDAVGHDACRLVEREDGWRLEGVAVFRHEGLDAGLSYAVECDALWRTRKGVVQGWVGTRALSAQIAHTTDGWTLNGRIVPGLDECEDLDLGFTPATNLFQLRRTALEPGEGADVPVAWLDVPGDTLEVLRQRYERRGRDAYWYEAPRFGYSALLRVNAVGFVEDYPGLWKAEHD